MATQLTKIKMRIAALNVAGLDEIAQYVRDRRWKVVKEQQAAIEAEAWGRAKTWKILDRVFVGPHDWLNAGGPQDGVWGTVKAVRKIKRLVWVTWDADQAHCRAYKPRLIARYNLRVGPADIMRGVAKAEG